MTGRATVAELAEQLAALERRVAELEAAATSKRTGSRVARAMSVPARPAEGGFDLGRE